MAKHRGRRESEQEGTEGSEESENKNDSVEGKAQEETGADENVSLLGFDILGKQNAMPCRALRDWREDERCAEI